MAKVVSVKRDIVPSVEQRKGEASEAASSQFVSIVGVLLTALLVLGAVAMVLMAFNYKTP